MKVEGSGKLRGGSSVRQGGKAEGTGGAAFSRQLLGEAHAAHGVNATSSLAGVSAVFAAQEVDDATQRASRGKMRAEEMLDHLDELRIGLLNGGLPREKLMDLTRIVQSRKVHVDDPRLAQILDEIDLRAQVELAKLQPQDR